MDVIRLNAEQAIRVHADQIGDALQQELLKFTPLLRKRGINRAFKRVARPSTRRFSHLIAEFDYYIGEVGIHEATKRVINRFARSVTITGAEHIPTEGPLVVAGNHPGSIDILAYLSAIPRRDINVVVANPAIKVLRHGMNNVIFVRPKAVRQPGEVSEQIVEKLKQGQCVIIYPAGGLEPDPAWFEGAVESVERWSKSLSYFAEQVPNLQVIPAAISGSVSRQALQSHTVRHFRNLKTRQRYGIFYGLARNAIKRHYFPVDMNLMFRPAITKDIKGKWLLPAVKTEVQSMIPKLYPKGHPLMRGTKGW